MLDSGYAEEKLEALSDFRDWLVELREDDRNRLRVRRNGYAKVRADGSLVMGPFTIDVRTEILRKLKSLQEDLGEELISEPEIAVIEDIWSRDDIRDQGRIALDKSFEQMAA